MHLANATNLDRKSGGRGTRRFVAHFKLENISACSLLRARREKSCLVLRGRKPGSPRIFVIPSSLFLNLHHFCTPAPAVGTTTAD
jgi:hypothetical protein